MNLKSKRFLIKQRGTFSVEFAIVGIFFSLLLAFSGDVIIKLSVKGKLDRLSFSLVNIVKEQTQFYDPDSNKALLRTDAQHLEEIASNSLRRTLGTFNVSNFGVLVEEVKFSSENVVSSFVSYDLAQQTCAVSRTLQELKNISVMSSWDRQVPLYRVTLCYETDNWIGDLLGSDFTTVSSSSIMIGR